MPDSKNKVSLFVTTVIISWLVGVLWHINLCRLFIAKSIFMKLVLLLYSHDQLYKHICMQNHNDTTIKTSDTVLYKNILLTFFERVRKGYSRFYCERELETEQNCNILTPTLMAISVSFPLSWVTQPGAWGPTLLGAGFLYHFFSPTATAQSEAWGPTLLGAGFLYCILSPTAQSGGPRAPSAERCFLYSIISPTDRTSCALSYIIVQRPPSSCGRHKSHSFNPSTVKVISWYSSTRYTCYLHRCISYFDSLAGLEVNIQHYFKQFKLE